MLYHQSYGQPQSRLLSNRSAAVYSPAKVAEASGKLRVGTVLMFSEFSTVCLFKLQDILALRESAVDSTNVKGQLALTYGK